MKKLLVLAAAGVGYVLGAKAGRQRYETIKSGFLKVKNNPTVQEKAGHVAEVAKEQAPFVKDRIVGAAEAAAHKVKPGGNSDGEPTEQLHPDSTARQQNPYPQGDLP
jgi:hypothetical protein